MPTEYQFEKVWFLFYLFGVVALGGWLFIVVSVAQLFVRELKRRRQNPSDPGYDKRYMRQFTSFCLFLIGLSTVLCATLAFVTGASYLTRFDTEGITYLSATGWKREQWKDASKVILVTGTKPFLRI
jgi:hypothetical protein